MSFIFGGSTNLTPEEAKRRRQVADSLRASIGGARDIGGGLADLGKGIAATLMANSADRAERKGRAGANAKFAPLLSALLGGGGAPAADPSITDPVTDSLNGSAGSDTLAGGGGVPKGKQGFIDMLAPAAIQYGNQIGVDPRIILAQAAQETGWGRSAPGNNYFGIKSHGKGGGQTFTTHEVINGKRVKMQDSFRSFNDPADSVAGYADFLTSNKRYRPMLGAKGLEEQVAALGRSGYATDPNYANSIYNIAKGINLDGVQPASAPMGSGMTGFPPAQAPAPAQIAAAPSQAPQIVPTAGPAPQAPQMAPQAPMSAYQRMMATSLGKEAGGLAAPPNRAQMASVMGQGSNGAGGGIMERLFGAGGGAPPSPMAAPQPMSNPNNPQTQATMGPVAANAAAMSPQQVAQGAAQELDAFPNEQLIALMNDPYINDQQRGIVEFVLKKRMEQQFPDPGAQMDMQLKQLQIEEKKKALQPKAGYRPATAAEKQAVGLDPTTPAQVGPDNKVEPISGGANSGTKWREVTLDDGVYAVDEANPQNRVKIGARPDRNEGEGRTFSQETKFRSEYMKESQPFIDLRTNYTRINAASQDQTGASDIALVYSYMKMLDPTSVVREGEFATAENAGGIPQQIQSLYNKAVNGQRLAPEVRADFLKQAKRQYDGQLKTYGSIRKKWQELAVKNGLNPENVAPNINYDEQPAPDSGTKIPAEAIGLLKADPSGEAVREFNEVFGAGAAERILQESANDRK